MKILSKACLVTLLAMGTIGSASAATVFSGSDDGASVSGPFANSAAAQAAFLAAAAAFGPVTTDGFEATPLGFSASTPINGAVITTASPNFGSGFSGVNNTNNSNLVGFNTTVGGANWYGFPDSAPASATFTFAQATNSFGFYITGVQTTFSSSFTLTQGDGAMSVFTLPINVNGGTNYFGIVDDRGFNSITLTLGSSGDAWGIDDVSFNAGAAVPEASTWAMLILGFGLVGAAARRHRVSAIA